MDDPNMTMEKYIKLEEEKAHRHGRVFNWQTATYGNIRIDDNLHDLSSVEAEFQTIVINDAFAPQDALQCKSQNAILSHYEFMYEGLEYSNTDITNFEARLARIHRREVHRVQGVSLFTSQAWRRLFYIRGPLVNELILEFYSTFRFVQAILDLDTPETLQFQLGGAKRRMDVESVNVPYLLARYLRFLDYEDLGGLTVIAPELPIIDMAEQMRLQICVQFDDTWAWVAMGPERQPDAVAGTPAVAKDAPAVDEGNQAVLVPVQAPQQPPPPPPASYQGPIYLRRFGRLEEGICRRYIEMCSRRLSARSLGQRSI
ncbi:hypothetical protein Tco_1080182 [Tanacetum coccineum]|uniref:Uncharacterized protein n=1 Tax=Tanacetum coccineum TaxID=301880 RepID=A0ABQ5HTZ2_9ASTR